MSWLAGIAEGRRAEFVAKTSTRNVGSLLTLPATMATPQSRDSCLLSHQETRGSMSTIIVRSDSLPARSSTSSNPARRS
jgi:hypothetical protein